MPIDFPASPTLNDTFPSGSKKWIWTGEQWAARNASARIWKTISANYQSSNEENLSADTTSGAFTITLPASPSFGTNVTIVDAKGTWDTNNLTIARNGSSTIEGLSENLVCDVNGDMVMTLLYNGSTWKVYV